MKNILSQEQLNEIRALCKKYGIAKYEINNDGSIDVDDNVSLYDRGFDRLPIKFNKVNGFFKCYHNALTTLEGCPVEIAYDFDCSYNNLSSLEFGPVVVGGGYNCAHNNITSLQGAPSEVKYEFKAIVNELTSLEYAPKNVGRNYYFAENNLPSVFTKDFMRDQDKLKIFIKYQDHFDVWDNGFNEQGFNDLMAEIEEGLQ